MINELKSKIMMANRLYRDGKPIISDEAYDTLLETLQSKIPTDEFVEFNKTLFEAAGKIQLPYVVGSLQKCTYGTDQLEKWLNKYQIKEVFCSDKIDGMAFIAHYKDGNVQAAYSRGNGILGEDITEKCLHILPKAKNKLEFWVRGELLLTEVGRERFNYENRRNGTVGLMKNDNYDPAHLKTYIVPYFHGMLGTDKDIILQFMFLRNEFPLNTVRFFSIRENIEESLLEATKAQKDFAYIADGIVVYYIHYKNENVYHPELARAFKVNKEGVITKVTGIKWNVSKNGNLKPVLQIEPVKIDGTTVRNVTGYNYHYLNENGINIGSVVKVLKAGEIIPKIVDVIEKSPVRVGKLYCPSCGGETIVEGVELKCEWGTECTTAGYKSVATFLRGCGVEGISWVGVKNYGFNCIADVLKWEPDLKYSTDKKLAEELKNKVFTKTAEDLFSRFSFDGIGKITIDAILKVYTLEEIGMKITNNEWPKPVHGISMNGLMNINSNLAKNYIQLLQIMGDPRWNPKKEQPAVVSYNKLNGKKFLITGTLSKPRKHFETLIKENGGVIASGVNKELDYLVVGEDAGSKLEKAIKLRIITINEQQFMEMLK